MSATTYQAAWFKRQPFWRRAERTAAQQLRLHGVNCKLISRDNRDWDIVTRSGLKIECKAARILRGRVKRDGQRKPAIRGPFWVIGVARPKTKHKRITHQLRERGISFYVVRLLGGEFGKVWLILPAPLKTKQLQITPRQLVTKYAANFEAWHLIADKEASRASRS